MNGCPWGTLPTTTIALCESIRCAWIAQPSNAWSSLIYCGVGAYLWFRPDLRQRPALRAMGVMAFLIGVTSFFYHASMTFLGEYLDLGSMFLLSNLLITLNLRRLGWLGPRAWLAFYAGLTAVSLDLMAVLHGHGILIFGIQVAVAVGLEMVLVGVEAPRPTRRHFFAGLALFAFSYLIWKLDARKIVCDPENHWFQGHAVWHILDAGVILLLERFYRQFRLDLPRQESIKAS